MLASQALRSTAVSVRAGIVALFALVALFVALVLMHGMSTGSGMAHASPVPVATAGSTIASPDAGDGSSDLPATERAVALAGSGVDDAAAPTVQSFIDLSGPEGDAWLGFTVFMLLVTVLLALRRGVGSSRGDVSARVLVFVRNSAGTSVPAIPLRLATSIDRR